VTLSVGITGAPRTRKKYARTSRRFVVKIKKKLSQHRRDFTAIYVCEGCGTEVESSGYDDENFHNNVIPALKCVVCNRTSAECGATYEPMKPEYPDGYLI
jgi:ribosomal protein L37AE/L43A